MQCRHLGSFQTSGEHLAATLPLGCALRRKSARTTVEEPASPRRDQSARTPPVKTAWVCWPYQNCTGRSGCRTVLDVSADEPETTVSEFEYYIEEIGLCDGTVVTPPRAGVTAIVGGNNSGKSTLLRQVTSWTQVPTGQPLVTSFELVKSVSTWRGGTAEQFMDWLDAHRPRTNLNAPERYWQRTGGAVINESRASSWPDALPHLENWGTDLLRVDTHMNTDNVEIRNFPVDPPVHPLHVLEDDPESMARLNKAVADIFGEKLTLDNSGKMRSLRLGTTTTTVPGLLDDKTDYHQALASLPQISEQGEGMQRVIGMLLPLITSLDPVVVIDEPEAYLHPPQARAIGAFIGRTARELSTQVLLATHDRNILAGLLDSKTDLAVVRLNRLGNETSAHTLSVEELREVWADPVLRYSNVLDGLFHRMVVLAEGDPDCRFYQAAVDALNDAEPDKWPRTSDILFVSSYGKQNLFKLASALQAVRVPVVASPDLDVLNNEGTLRKLVESLGGDWSEYASSYKKSTAPFTQPADQVTVATVVGAVATWLDGKLAEDKKMLWSKELKDEFRQLTRAAESPWAALKAYGLLAFKGESAKEVRELLAALAQQGVVVVQVGALEGFAPALGLGKGSEWLPAALEAGAHSDKEALDHVRRIIVAGTGATPEGDT